MISGRMKRKFRGFLKNVEKHSAKIVLIPATTAIVLFAGMGISNAVKANIDKKLTNEPNTSLIYYETVENINQNDVLNNVEFEDVDSQKSAYADLEFEAIKYAGKTYLTLNQEDMLKLIERAMLEVDDEYINNGATSVFSSTDTVYSQFTPEHIYGLMSTETDMLLLQLKDGKNLYDTSNYSSFNGESKGIVYHGLGMVSENSLNDIVNRDRRDVNRFDDYSAIEIDGERVELKFDNLDAYNYVINSGATTESEIKEALAENIMLNTKCIYILLNRIVKDHVKEGKHDVELNALTNYKQLAKMSEVDAQIFFALLGYNQGQVKTVQSVLDGSLFKKDANAEYINNIKYPLRAMERAEQARISEQGEVLQQ